MATNEDNNIGKGKETEPSIVLEFMQALEKLKITVETNKNKQNYDELSDRLRSIEASISGDSQRSKGTTNTNDVAVSKSKKQFKLKHVFKNVSNFKENVEQYSEKEDHYNTIWSIGVQRRNNHLAFFIYCKPIAQADKWSIRTKLKFKVVGPNQNDVIRTWDVCYEKSIGSGFGEFMGWEEMLIWYLMDGNLTVEVNVEIDETTGLSKEKIRKFDESQKDVSDVTLVVGDTKFYVSKMFLAAQSSVFKTLLLGNFTESKKSEVKLNGIDPDDFHYFLEVLYGESAIDDTTVEGVALLADMYDVPTAIRKCEEFLLEKSKKTSYKKLKIATRYNLEKLKEMYS
ncbi:hypothetical protein B9Z55_007700 [Caenorhabditis nigoni]|uniref:BTB domain-containing protein n=1 Tax=Caenorhabditis nigoni TaxID=1611254 RepID=A0A2G5VBH3_9PELO|nr:hypothetical protein B9Z55_007700 [Caenorhabditis nigoni]